MSSGTSSTPRSRMVQSAESGWTLLDIILLLYAICINIESEFIAY